MGTRFEGGQSLDTMFVGGKSLWILGLRVVSHCGH